MTFYKTTEQITETCDYEFKLPKYPKTTTDPTYYEPQATRIANMRKSASSGKALYDFENGELVDPTKITTMFGRKPYLTQEEVAHITTQNQLRMENDIKEYDENTEAENKIIEMTKKQAKAAKAAMNSDSEGSSVSE